MSTTTHMICNINSHIQIQPQNANPSLVDLLKQANLNQGIISAYTHWLETQPDLRFALDTYFKSPLETRHIPLFILNEQDQTLVTLFANKQSHPSEPGEPGSILAYVRANSFDDKFMCSDCFGQLSCSSCAVEILAGSPKNPVPRDEEFDMLDIDEQKPPTEKTRLGCQTVVGNEALVIMIRKPHV